MGTACTSSTKKNQKEFNDISVSAGNKEKTNVEIDVVPDDQIPKGLIERTLKKVDTTDVDDVLDLNSPLNMVISLIFS